MNNIDTYLKQNIIFNCTDSFKLDALYNFSKRFFKRISIIKVFVEEFDNSLKDPQGKLSFYSYLEQINFFKIYNTSSPKSVSEIFHIIHSFYTFYQINYDYEVFSKSGYSTTLLTIPGTALYISQGYEVINLNELSPVPDSDKWLLCYKNTKSSDMIKMKKINFLKIENKYFRNWCKQYIWYKNTKFNTTITTYYASIQQLNYINSLKNQTVRSYFVTKINKDDDINTQEIKALKNYILTAYKNDRTQLSLLSRLRNLLVFVSENNIHKFQTSVFYELSHISPSSQINTSLPINNFELKLIANKMFSLAEENNLYKMYYIIFYLLLTTEFRISQILNLDVDCIKKTSKNDEYVLLSETKTSKQELIEQPISNYTKECISEVLRLTSVYREKNTNKELNKLLFICEGNKIGTYTQLQNSRLNRFFSKICKGLELPHYSLANLRDTHMLKSEEFIIKEKLSDTQLNILTSHSHSSTTIKHYSKLDIIEMLEATNGIVIGDVTINGKILNEIPNNIASDNNLVSDNCGYCSALKCHINSDLSCLLCKDFVTTINRKPYFEEQIKLIDSLILTKSLQHDKEDLINRKRLFLKYLEAIIKLQIEDIYE